MDKKATIILVPSSHWDREWYLSYRRTQMRLVRLINKVLHLTAGEGYSFLLDGQTIMLEDYLEIYPEHEELMKTLRIALAEWYSYGHVDEEDPNTVILKVNLTQATVIDNGNKYELIQED